MQELVSSGSKGETMEKYSSFAQTTIGERHIQNGVVCQDYSMSINNSSFAFAAVADGHGSPHYLRTDRGSRLAAECALDCVCEFLDTIKDHEFVLDDEKLRDDLLQQLWKNIVTRWKSRVEADFRSEPFTKEELDKIPEEFAVYRSLYEKGEFLSSYGTTLAFIVATDYFAFCGQIGDGKCVVVDCSGITADPVPDDPRCYDNITTSICQEDAEFSARFVYYPKEFIPAAMFIGTDGLQNSYWDIEQLHSFYRGLTLDFAENGLNEGIRQLAEFLPVMTSSGSGDDISCAGIVDINSLQASLETLRNAVSYIEAPAPVPSDMPEDMTI